MARRELPSGIVVFGRGSGRSLGNLFEEHFERGRRVGRLGDRAADDEHAGSGANGGFGGGDSTLIAADHAGAANAWGDQQGLRAQPLAEGSDFPSGADQAGDAGAEGEVGQPEDLIAWRCGDADLGERCVIHAGQDSDGQQLGVAPLLPGGGRSGFEHSSATGGVDGEQAGSGGGNGADRARDGVGDIVKLEVQEDAQAALPKPFDEGQTGGAEQLQADLNPAAAVAERVDQRQRGICGREVERDDEAIFGIGLRRCGVLGHRGPSGRRSCCEGTTAGADDWE